MQHRCAVAQRRQARAATGCGERQRRPADLFAVAAIDTDAERPRQQLAAEADAEHRLAGAKPLLMTRSSSLRKA
jgi:hypothetical protein